MRLLPIEIPGYTTDQGRGKKLQF